MFFSLKPLVIDGIDFSLIPTLVKILQKLIKINDFVA